MEGLIEKTRLEMPPGSSKAGAAGCTCPVIENHYGRGYRGRKGEYVICGTCPVHRPATVGRGRKK